ncbi:MAG: polysaccharide biosynthesis protein [Caulobacteraceae bacterium]|nr:polysaccharide biosynthesis protein [Caulobacteraceae bacterium]
MFDRAAELPRSALFLAWVLDVLAFAGVLTLRRAMHEGALTSALVPFVNRRNLPERRVMLLGEMDSADAYLRELARSPDALHRAVGLVTPHSADRNQEVRGISVLGDASRVEEILDGFMTEAGQLSVLFLDGSVAPADLDGDLVARLKARDVRLLKLNRVTELDGELARSSVRELDFNELLARPPVHLDHERVRRLITGKRVLVTGAGGSIGSEICRQVAALSCSHLAMLDNSEFALFKIEQEMIAAYPTLSKAARLCDVRDAARLRTFALQERPDIVFHAAALKHVPLMEAHPADSVLTNVIGSANVADAAVAAGVQNFVFISTDKTVDPPNVMGATKRLAERTVCQRRRPGGPRFNVVRFGNVLGSAGSVVPTFLAQIARGGPVTLTHPDIERFFMTIPEAVQLVLHATAKSAFDQVEGVLVLDMGKPVKIIDLARRLIELDGKVPGIDVEIRVTGLRPGEKMTEALFDVTETARQCDPGVLEVVDRNAGVSLSDAELRRLENLARSGDDEGVRELLFKLLDKLRTYRADNVRAIRDAS